MLLQIQEQFQVGAHFENCQSQAQSLRLLGRPKSLYRSIMPRKVFAMDVGRQMRKVCMYDHFLMENGW